VTRFADDVEVGDDVPSSLVDHISKRLRVEILTGAIKPGERIRIPDFEKRFGVSHIPIREALRRLEAEGLVAAAPRRAIVATGLALEDLEGLYDLRRLIEAPVAARAVSQMTAEDVENVRLTLERLEAIDGGYASEEFWRHHADFHWALLAPGANERLRRTLGQLWQDSQRYVRLSITAFGSYDLAMQQHREMFAACVARDSERLAQILIEHLSHTEDVVREGYFALQAGTSAEPARGSRN
jgi:DNA-binding GntR family transcriptional regulator